MTDRADTSDRMVKSGRNNTGYRKLLKEKRRNRAAGRRQAMDREIPEMTADPETQGSLRDPLIRDLLLLLLKAGLLAAVLSLMFLFVFGVVRSSDLSMAPAVKDGDLVLYYRLDQDYVQGDVTVLETADQTQIRRVVAVAGDTVDILPEGGLIVNGAFQQEQEIYEATWRYDQGIQFPVTLQEGEIFLLGDSRENSTDSRIYGPVRAEDTKGTVITIIRGRGI